MISWKRSATAGLMNLSVTENLGRHANAVDHLYSLQSFFVGLLKSSAILIAPYRHIQTTAISAEMGRRSSQVRTSIMGKDIFGFVLWFVGMV